MDLASVKKFFASLTLQKLVPVILIVVIGLLLVKLLLKLFDRVLERSRLERTMFSFLRAVMRALLYTILVLVAGKLPRRGRHVARRHPECRLPCHFACRAERAFQRCRQRDAPDDAPVPRRRLCGDRQRQRHRGGDQRFVYEARYGRRQAHLHPEQRRRLGAHLQLFRRGPPPRGPLYRRVV